MAMRRSASLDILSSTGLSSEGKKGGWESLSSLETSSHRPETDFHQNSELKTRSQSADSTSVPGVSFENAPPHAARKARAVRVVADSPSDDPDAGASNNLSMDTSERHRARVRRRASRRRSRIYDEPAVVAGYASVPLLELDRLPRGGLSFETKAVGRIQFGIPPETIKDSMRLGFGVPSIYVVPAERFCREIGPALGINLAEFEFPAYFNYFIRLKRCTLIVDSLDAESNIRRVFAETLLGPEMFRHHKSKKPNVDEDFSPTYPPEARPNFYKEFYHFRTAEEASNYEELTIDMLLDFCHFKGSEKSRPGNHKLGVPPIYSDFLGGEKEDSSKTRRRNTTLLPVANERKHPNRTIDDVKRERRPADKIRLAEVCRNVGGLRNVQEQDDGSESDQRSLPLRRIKSDPDMKRLSLDSLSQSTNVSQYSDVSFHDPDQKDIARRGSTDSATSFLSRGGRSRGGMSWADGASFMLASDDEDDPTRNTWMYSQAKWLGEVATVYPLDATEEQKVNNETARVEIFKMTGGTEYIVHDVDENNIIIGKARFSGTVRVPDEIAVEGFLSTEIGSEEKVRSHVNSDEETDSDAESDSKCLSHHLEYGTEDEDFHFSIQHPSVPPTFHPPSFGVTVLGNSHGFDKSGSVSGYVLWINGRGVMIDPPPYSSATLEREGIRPQMIVAIIITHCHADHDAGTFQKVMTGLRVAIITTPTIYKSFIRKYAALSGLSPTLLRHSHRHRPAIVGQPLKFQGAVFHFSYTLHTIPCVGFKVEWRGRSMVFTGDHLNNPPVIDRLEKKGVLTKERADALRSLPLQECDALLHEAGAPPIHTPLSVLQALPNSVKQRLYVVHTSALPDDCGLRVAPTGTAGTIRLDHISEGTSSWIRSSSKVEAGALANQKEVEKRALESAQTREELCDHANDSTAVDAKVGLDRLATSPGTYGGIDLSSLDDGGYPNLSVAGDFIAPNPRTLLKQNDLQNVPPLVLLRPTCVSDAWFILNLLSAVPFLSSLSYANTMEVLEIARVEMFCENEVVIPAERRSEVLCVVWEGTCVESYPAVQGAIETNENDATHYEDAQALDELDYENVLFSEEDDGLLRRFNPTVWHAGDWTGPLSLQPDPERSSEYPTSGSQKDIVALSAEGVKVIMLNMTDLYQILKNGSKLFRKYLALKEKQALEEAAMKAHMMRNEARLQSGANHGDEYRAEEQVPNHWNAFDSVLEVIKCNSALGKLSALQKRHLESLAEGPRFFEAGQFLWQVGNPVDFAFLIVTGTAVFASKHEEQRLLDRRASTGEEGRTKRMGVQRIQEDKQLFNVPPNSEYARLEVGLQLRAEEMESDVFDQTSHLLPKEQRMRNSRDRFANKVLARLYSRRAYTAGLVFSRGHWLSDTSRMVSGSLAHIQYGSRREDKKERAAKSITGGHHCHTSNMVAGNDGCVVMVFPRPSLVQFLDGYPGVLLSLLGTQVVV